MIKQYKQLNLVQDRRSPMVYLMSDIHGDYNRFIELYHSIPILEEDQLYLLGDVIDKNQDGIKMLDFCMKSKNVTLIKGNHERWMEEYFLDPSSEDLWCKRGGEATLRDLKELDLETRKQYFNYLKSLPLYIKLDIADQTVILTHTGYRLFVKPCYKTENLVDIEKTIQQIIQLNENEYLSYSDLFSLEDTLSFNYHCYVGHVPTFWLREDKKAEIMYTKNYTNLDCGAGHQNLGGRLACLCLDTMQEWYA